MDSQRFKAVLLFGAPGVGKGTQGRILAQIPGLVHVASGDLFRSLDDSTPAGRQAAEYMARGELVPDELTVRIWRDAVEELIARGRFRPQRDLLVLDGIPRTVSQAKMLDAHIDVLKIIQLDFSHEDQIVARLKGRASAEGRPDDADEAIIRHRFEVYRRQSKPLLTHYRPELLSQVDAMGRPAEVLRDILDCLIPVLPS